MTNIIHWEEIRPLLKNLDLATLMEDGFKAYSRGEVVVPPVGEMIFENPKGECHIKYGYIKEDDYYVIKIASGFPENNFKGISASQGMMLVFSKHTGEVEAVLLDEGKLTNIRTAVAGAIASKWLSPKEVSGIGIIGTGIQARLQLEYHLKYFHTNNIWVAGRNKGKLEKFVDDFRQIGLEVNIGTTDELTAHCNLIVTTTSATKPVLKANQIKAGTHITAVGSDTPHKNEIDVNLFPGIEVVVADSISQCLSRGEIYQALKAGTLDEKNIIELGSSLDSQKSSRKNDQQITLADLTGVAVQDIQIAKAVYQEYKNKIA